MEGNKVDLGFLANMSNSSLIIIFAGVIGLVIVVAYLANRGIVSWNGKLKIGSMDLERTIIRQQITYLDSAIQEYYTEVKHTKTWNEWKSKCVAHAVKDVLEKAISYNHITTESSYVLVKQKECWAAIQEFGMDDKYYTSNEFKQLIYGMVSRILEDLISIRNFYKNGGMDK